MSANLYYFILLSGSIIAACAFIFLYKRRSRSLNNPVLIAPLVLEAIDEAVIITDTSNIIKYVNQACLKLLKIPQKEIVGKKISEIFTMNQILLTPGSSETSISTRDNETIRVSSSVNKILNKSQKLEGYNIILEKNETAKKNVEEIQKKTEELANLNNLLEEIKKNKEKIVQNILREASKSTLDVRDEYTRLYASVNNLTLGFIMADKENNIIMANNTAKNLFSIPDLDANIKLQNLQTRTQDNINFLKNGGSVSYENIRIGDKYANIFISPVITPSETTGIVILTEDITRERIEEKSREDFFTIASHELRAPLTAIRGYIAIIKQLFAASIKEEELKKIINDIDTLSARLINIVNDFLDTPKLEQGKIRVKKEPCELIEIINACIKETMSIAAPKNLFVNFTSPFKTAAVLGDKERIRQILINLISNGIKYTEQGGITIYIEKTPDSRYKISIKDTGKGVPKENIKFLFSKFQRTDPAKHMTSTGLGLYISKLLVEKMNGTINLENTQEGKGSTFSFALPAYEQTIANSMR